MRAADLNLSSHSVDARIRRIIMLCGTEFKEIILDS